LFIYRHKWKFKIQVLINTVNKNIIDLYDRRLTGPIGTAGNYLTSATSLLTLFFSMYWYKYQIPTPISNIATNIDTTIMTMVSKWHLEEVERGGGGGRRKGGGGGGREVWCGGGEE
jgi:hypothetical protein